MHAYTVRYAQWCRRQHICCIVPIVEDAENDVGLGLGRASISNVLPHYAQRSLVQHSYWDVSCHPCSAPAVRLSLYFTQSMLSRR